MQTQHLNEMLKDPGIEADLREAMRHGLESNGSGFRARLVEAVCKACKLSAQRASALADALEYLHLASLMLDDLPCMDDACSRRGLACTHILYGESMTILSALALINRAYYLIWAALGGLGVQQQRAAGELVDQCLGLNGILNGQALDLHFARTDHSPATIERIAILKTGSLLQLSILLPAIICGMKGDALQLLRRLADRWGSIYQLLDDFKDTEWAEKESGKTSQRDAALKRPNLINAIGKERAVARMRRHLWESRRLLRELSVHHGIVSALEPFQAGMEESAGFMLAAYAA